jgi:hypothetical protein
MVCLWLSLGGALNAADSAPVFEKDVLPLLTAKCIGCHGPKVRTAGLDLHEISLVMHGGQNGPVVLKGSAKDSLLWKRVREGSMPPGKEKLAEEDVELLRRWIDSGAPAAAKVAAVAPLGPALTGKDREFWSFRPLSKIAIPSVRQRDLVRTPVDAFLLSKLEAKELTYAAPAAQATLIRRVYLDLLGLPPGPEEVDAFVADRSPDAYARLVDKLLASPHFGERFGRYWLDLAGYVDTVGRDVQSGGYVVGVGRWLYRDWVIQAFNEDKPYNEFLKEQFAGDEMFDWRRAEKYTPPQVAKLVATGFLRTAEDPTDQSERDNPLLRYEVLHQTMEIMTSSVLGLTVGCARCHDHKFDPIPQRDYYRLMANLTPAYNAVDWTPVTKRALADVPPPVKESIDKDNKALDEKLKPLKTKLEGLLIEAAKPLFAEKAADLPETDREAALKALAVPEAKRTPQQRRQVDKVKGVRLTLEALGPRMDEAKRAEAASLEREIAELERGRRKYRTLECMYDTGAPPETFVHRRGDFESKGATVGPGGLEVLSADGSDFAPEPPFEGTSGRRLALADWLTREGTPAASLVARVYVNRLWLDLFGQGLVATPENFGAMGARPTHPELLDWLASELQRNGWRTKPLLRLMLNARAYQQSSRTSDYPGRQGASPEKADPENSLLWRMRLRRLESEAIRDSMLAVSGTLNPKVGGPAVKTTTQADGMVLVSDKDLADPKDRYRRSLYLVARRRYNLSLLGVFDQPVMSTNATTRGASAVVLQSLMMLNDAEVDSQAHHFADRVEKAAGATLDAKLNWAFRYAFGRRPDSQELEWARSLYQRELDRYLSKPQPEPAAGREALASVCHVLLNSNEFLYRQ